jgi:predicted 3-demethylubiquinone-9 3-methyltransferase (glyoxalase superfamily)
MRKITPYLWFNDQAEEASRLYASLFKDAAVSGSSRYAEGAPRPAGSLMSVTVRLPGLDFIALNGGPAFAFTPAISFFVRCGTEGELDALWRGLSAGGTVLMDQGAYPFSARYGWVQDRFGVSWQLSLVKGPRRISPFLMFSGNRLGRAEEAIRSYVSLFDDSRVDSLELYGAGQEGPAGTVRRADFTLAGQAFMAVDSAMDHAFTFTPAVSMFVSCGSQEEVDRLWTALGAGGKEMQCGWLTDRFGVAWQVVPDELGRLLSGGTPEQSKRVMAAMLKMVKLDAGELRRAAEGL